MNRFQTPNPGRFKRKEEKTGMSNAMFFASISLVCFSLLIGKYVGQGIYLVLKAVGVF